MTGKYLRGSDRCAGTGRRRPRLTWVARSCALLAGVAIAATACGSSGSSSAPSASSTTSGSSTATKAPIVVGLVGTFTGAAGASVTPARDTYLAWVKAVNAKGGINGHPVKVEVADDGGNLSQSLSLVREMVESKHAIAIAYFGLSVVPITQYVNSKRVPVVGIGAYEGAWNANPMLFPELAGVEGHFESTVPVIQKTGKTKVGLLYCTDNPSCKADVGMITTAAKGTSLKIVATRGITFTQPDFTAECLALKKAGADVVVPLTISVSIGHIAQSCGRQGYKPTYVTTVADDNMLKVSDLNGAYSVTAGFPWFLRSGSPAVQEYADALQKYAPDLDKNGLDVQTWGWISGKLLEKAAANVSDTPTSQEILDGLWSTKNDTLGGLTTARTFVKDKPASEVLCAFESKISDGKWSAPQGTTPICKQQ